MVEVATRIVARTGTAGIAGVQTEVGKAMVISGLGHFSLPPPPSPQQKPTLFLIRDSSISSKMLLGHLTVERAIDARDQFVAMCLALCPPPPTIPSRQAPHLTNDVAKHIGQRCPARRFIASTGLFFSTVVSIGPTLGVVNTDETDEWTPCFSQAFDMQVMDLTAVTARTTQSPPYHCDKFWGSHKWVLAWRPGELYIHKVVISPSPSWVLLDGAYGVVNVVFSRTEPGTVGFGDEALVMVLTCDRKRVMTVDLEKSFSAGTTHEWFPPPSEH
ncbi:hypothetical protein Pelo_18217 [Pelomyxa schiedti]|nr:hypothetical protein Pelo_18217 [Pelomyxa schiedti]